MSGLLSVITARKLRLLVNVAAVNSRHCFSNSSKLFTAKHSLVAIQVRNNCHNTAMVSTSVQLTALRELMRALPANTKSIQAYIIPTDDAHQSEYICDRDNRRTFICGFNGSAGTAVVTEKDALLWTDGRYYQQAAKQLDNNWTLMKDGLPGTVSIETWLTKNLAFGSRVGVDPSLVSYKLWNQIKTALKNNESELVPITENLVDAIWTNQPQGPTNKVIVLDTCYAGKTVGEKITEIRVKMSEKDVNTLVITGLDEVAWLLNLRGSDINFNPVFFSYAIVTDANVHLFVDKTKMPSDYGVHFSNNNVDIQIHAYEDVQTVLKSLAELTDKKVWISLGSSYALTSLIPEKQRLQEITPIAVMKALKNNTEAKGIINCHIRDGVALCQYFAWLEQAVQNNEYVDEITGATKLEEFRKTKEKFMGLSFSTISASGPNGSVIHYHPAEETKRQINAQEIYLCDSGAQYLDGTTDVTRTMHFGVPTDYQKECYTRVLKGQISLGTTIFPNKVKGQVLDTLARKALWDVGLDYGHGTGHGIGHFLNVHEGPQGIGIRLMPDDPGLQQNMFVSNEPGYYEDGCFGIRIEDIVQIVDAQIAKNFSGRGALTFKTVTMCPIQTKMVDVDLLSAKERQHLNDYHKIVWETLSPILNKENDVTTSAWLKRETKAI